MTLNCEGCKVCDCRWKPLKERAMQPGPVPQNILEEAGATLGKYGIYSSPSVNINSPAFLSTIGGRHYQCIVPLSFGEDGKVVEFDQVLHDSWELSSSPRIIVHHIASKIDKNT